MRNRGTKDEDVERDNYKVPALIEVISDSDWAADRESRQSVPCGVIMVNGNLVHFQSKRQKSVALSSCEAETIAATSILSEGVFFERIVGKNSGCGTQTGSIFRFVKLATAHREKGFRQGTSFGRGPLMDPKNS